MLSSLQNAPSGGLDAVVATKRTERFGHDLARRSDKLNIIDDIAESCRRECRALNATKAATEV